MENWPRIKEKKMYTAMGKIYINPIVTESLVVGL